MSSQNYNGSDSPGRPSNTGRIIKMRKMSQPMRAVITARIVEKSRAARTPMMTAINTQIDAMNAMSHPTTGMNARMRKMPGELAKPTVRATSPQLA